LVLTPTGCLLPAACCLLLLLLLLLLLHGLLADVLLRFSYAV
jgi:hypothetical protein